MHIVFTLGILCAIMVIVKGKGVLFMANTSMNIRMDTEIKKQAQQLFAEFGLDMTTAVNMFLRQSIREHAIPFKLQLDIPNKETIAAIEEAEQMKNDPSIGKSYTDIDEMMRELLK